ncbi:MAG TPA: PKD domain-containing protein, partial [Nitrososphaeraceae archaeon]|nr:PKD domain-containing protein [Nitrososphaeraceae archaeon]
QPVTPAGINDYSIWNFLLNSSYASIKEGSNNKITAKLVCPPDLTKWYSVNVTGIPLSLAASNSTLISPSNLVNPKSVTRTSTTNNNPHFNASIINITSPVSGQQVPSGSRVSIFGTSMDDFYRDCKVFAKKNDLPFQNTTAAGLTGSRDYSVWRFAYTDEHGLITPGNTNNITAKISCNESKTFSYTSASIDSNNTKNTITSYANVVLMGINQPPVAAVHVNSQEAKEGDEIVLDGKDSSDPNGDPLTYFWKQTSGFLDGFDIINPTDSVAHFKVPKDLTKDTTFEFELDVRDNFGGISTESVSIDATSNTAPIADAGGNLQAIRGEQVTLDGSASHDPDLTGKIISYLWRSGEDNDGVAGLSLQNANQPVAVFSVPLVQDDTTFEFTLTVTDDEGAAAEDTVEVEVEAPTPPPPPPSQDPDPPEEPEDRSDKLFPSILNEEDEEIKEEQNVDSDLSSAELQNPEAIVETCFDGINIDYDGQFEEGCEP